MKKSLFPALSALVIATIMLTSCATTKYSGDSMKIVRDCTGTYLRFNEKDYQVCNLGKVASFADGQNVKATFKKIKVCTDKSQPEAVCMMYHQNEGWVEVIKINE